MSVSTAATQVGRGTLILNEKNTMNKFRRKSPVIEAMQLPLEDEEPSPELHAWLDEKAKTSGIEFESDYGGALILHTTVGQLEGRPGDWIICDEFGQIYPVRT